MIYRRKGFDDRQHVGVEVTFDAASGEFCLTGWPDGEHTTLALGYDRFERRFYASDQAPCTEEKWRRADPMVALVQRIWDAMVTHQQGSAK